MKLRLLVLFFLIGLGGHAQIARQWVTTYNGEGDFNDRYTCAATDVNGNILLGGSATISESDRDYLIVKLDSSGNVLWTKLIGSAGLGADEVLAITTDSAGFIYATGFSKLDYLTVKLDLNGDTVWTRTYDYNGEYDQANSIYVDRAGNVYVTGQSDQDITAVSNDDYTTIKYSSNGTQQWVQRFNGLGDAVDRAEKIVADDSGNVYITGRSDNGSNDDYVTIRYNSSGTQQWIRYDDRGGRDRATALAIDSSGNIYITGRSNNGTNDDYWTLKITSIGGLVWQVAYDFVDDDRASSLAIDATGNVYVTGQSDGDATALFNYDFATVAYNSLGTQIWQKRYAGATGYYDIANSIAVSNGNVFVTGTSNLGAALAAQNNIVSISYAASNGNQNGMATFAAAPNNDDAGLAVTATANGVVVAGYTEDANLRLNAIAIGYTPNMTQQWLRTYDGTGDNNDNVHALAIDWMNNVIVSGYCTEKGADKNMAVVKLNSSGGFVCKNSFNGSSLGSKDDGQGVFIDNAGNAIAAGFVIDKGTSSNIFWTELNGQCDTTWTRLYDGPAHNSDKMYDMCNDAFGNFYITGRIDTDPSMTVSDDCITMKFGPTGNLIWTRTFNNASTNEDRGTSIRAAASGNVYVSGKTFNGTDYDIFIIKFDGNGTQQWVQTYSGGFGDDIPRDMALDPSENIYITGSAEEQTDSVNDYITLKYNSAGGLAWAKRFDGAGGGDDNAVALAVDWQYSVVVTGQSDSDTSSSQNMDFTTIKYDSASTLVWAKSYNGVGNADDAGDDIQMNSVCHSYITGHTNKGTAAQPNYDIITMVLDINGDTLWTDLYNSSSDSSDIPNLLYIYGTDFYVAGSSVENNQMRNMIVLKYSGGFAGVENHEAGNNSISVNPNPFDNQLIIETNETGENFQLVNCLGEVVFEGPLVNGQNIIALPELASGVYFFFTTVREGKSSPVKLMHTE